jgi:hypothetical protein
VFCLGEPPILRPRALEVVWSQMLDMRLSGLTDAASEIVIGVNGGRESHDIACLIVDPKAKLVIHGPQSRSENLTIVEIEKWAATHPGWYVLYFHAKGCTHEKTSDYAMKVIDPWRNTMMFDLVTYWRRCVADLDSGFESVGSYFLSGALDGSQHLWCGNFWWAKSDFLAQLPSIYKRERIALSGIGSLESRFEAEVWIGNGRRPPIVKEYRPGGGGGIPSFAHYQKPGAPFAAWQRR